MTTSISQPLTCAVTGANGYVGSIIAAALQRAPYNVVGLCHTHAPSSANMHWEQRSFSLGDETPPGTFNGVDALIHCAYDFRSYGRSEVWRSNVDGTLQLFRDARAAGVKAIIFISSISAFPGCPSLYGQAKLAVEQEAEKFNLTVVRPGLVYGPNPRGMMGALLMLCKLPVVTPTVGLGGQVLHLAHEEDLGQLIAALAKSRLEDAGSSQSAGAVITAANEVGLTLKEILTALCESLGKRKRLFLPVPAWSIRAALRSLEVAGVRIRIRSDSLLGLLNQPRDPDFGPLHRVGVAFRTFDAASL